jgi:hypothetical protein
MTEDDVIRPHTQAFYGALRMQNFDILSEIYAMMSPAASPNLK